MAFEKGLNIYMAAGLGGCEKGSGSMASRLPNAFAYLTRFALRSLRL
jgi:hypothetical protein